MKKMLVKILLVLVFVFPKLAVGIEISEKLKGFIEHLESKQDSLQGGAIAILVKGNVIYKKAFGHKKGQNDPITEKTLFGLASVSKPISAIAVGLLVDKGQLTFNDKINLPYIKNQCTLTNVLSHTTGYKFPGNAQIEQGMSRKKLLTMLQKRTPDCTPGACYQYSNIMFSLIDDVLKQKHSSLSDAISHLNTVLNTEAVKLLLIKPNEDIAYPHSKNQLAPFPSYYQTVVPASAGIFASIDGMIEFFKLSFGYRPELISQNTLDTIFKPIISNTDVFEWHLDFPFEENKIHSYYGLGWRILKVQDQADADLIFHSGYIQGVRAFIGFVPSQEAGIIILSNESTIFPIQNGMHFWGAVLR